MFELEFSSQSKKFLKNLDNLIWERIIEKIKQLRLNPFPHDVKRVKVRKEKTFRVRVGGYKILYVVFKEKNLLFISKIEKRPKAY